MKRVDRTAARAKIAAAALLVLAAAEVPLDEAAHVLRFGNTGFVFILLTVFSGVGLLLALRAPQNPIGWIFLLFAGMILISDCVGDYSLLGYRLGHQSLPWRDVAASIASIENVAPVLVLPLPVLLFPDGRLQGRWRTVLRAYLALAASVLVGLAVAAAIAVSAAHVRVDAGGALRAIDHPSGSLAWVATIQTVGAICGLPILVAIIARHVLRFRRSRGAEREQLRWMLFGAVGSILAIAYFASGLDKPSTPVTDVVSSVAGLLLAALPAAMAVAILRYRLYDLDRLISRTVSYALLTALLAGAFIGVVALSTDVLPLSSRVGVAASTLVAAALFNPLRGRIQDAVDRRFNRARYDAQATVAAFTARLRDAVELEAVRGELLLTVQDALQPSHVSVWLR
jgi:hypothetical protein